MILTMKVSGGSLKHAGGQRGTTICTFSATVAHVLYRAQGNQEGVKEDKQEALAHLCVLSLSAVSLARLK